VTTEMIWERWQERGRLYFAYFREAFHFGATGHGSQRAGLPRWAGLISILG